MQRRIIKIDSEKCNGCGQCVTACHEGAIGMLDKKATLLRDDYCDGLGDCLPVCPTGAIMFEEREALEYNEAEVQQNKLQSAKSDSQLKQWPVQLKLVSVNSGFLENADLLLSADCAAYAYGNFHQDFMHDKVTVIACPKLDSVDYSEKITAMLKNNNIKTVTITRMEVPCCSGLEYALKSAIQKSGKTIPLNIVTITAEGIILRR